MIIAGLVLFFLLVIITIIWIKKKMPVREEFQEEEIRTGINISEYSTINGVGINQSTFTKENDEI